MRVPSKQIHEQLATVFRAWGMSDAHAETTAGMMVETDLRGVDSHGISMLPTYDTEFRAGRLNMKPAFKTARETVATALIDADASLGHPVSVHAMNLAVDKCLQAGVGIVSVFNSHHFGAAGCYARIAADRGVIGMVTSATRGVTMVPTFAAEPVLGTNPIAFAAPAGDEAPLVVDMATSVVAGGKIEDYLLKGKPVPLGWALDPEGNPTTDADAAQRGALLPLGGTLEMSSYKGYALSLIVETLCNLLTGMATGPERARRAGPGDPASPGSSRGMGHFFAAIDVSAFQPLHEFQVRMDANLRLLRAARPAPGCDRIYTPGEMEWERERERLVDGVPVYYKNLAALEELAGELGLAGPAAADWVE